MAARIRLLARDTYIMKTLCPGKYHRMPRQWRNAHSHVQASLIAYCGVVQASCSTTRRQQAAYGLQEAGMSTTHHNPQLCGAPCLPACPHAAHLTADYVCTDTCEKIGTDKKESCIRFRLQDFSAVNIDPMFLVYTFFVKSNSQSSAHAQAPSVLSRDTFGRNHALGDSICR